MSLARFVTLAALTLIVSAVTTSEASAQFRGRGYRPINRWPVAPWMWGVAMANRPPTIILPPGDSGGSGYPGGSQSALPSVPTPTVAIRVVLPVAGATISVNGVDFGKTEFFERNLQVPEAPDGQTNNYTVSATWMQNGKEVTQERQITVGKSGRATANFFVPQQNR